MANTVVQCAILSLSTVGANGSKAFLWIIAHLDTLANKNFHSKHMDKHDRPYICKKPECSSLQGFTYSGGLLRHQREVHGLHGGTKLKLFCHIDGCKRRPQQPFTRRDNLADHVRRKHKLNKPEPTSFPTNGVLSPEMDSAMQDNYSWRMQNVRQSSI